MVPKAILAGEITETLVEATEATTVGTQAASSLPEVKPLNSSETLLHPTTSALKTTKADTKRLIGAFRSVSSEVPKRPSPIVTSSNLFVPPLPLNTAPAFQR